MLCDICQCHADVVIYAVDKPIRYRCFEHLNSEQSSNTT